MATVMQTSSSNPQTGCRFFELPPELRNDIYSLVFNNAADTQDLTYHYFTANLKSKLPDKTLLLSCRAIYTEARKLYNHLYQKLWTGNAFKIPFRAPHNIVQQVLQLKDGDLAGITKLVIEGGNYGERVVYQDGLWREEVPGGITNYIVLGESQQLGDMTRYRRGTFYAPYPDLVKVDDSWDDAEVRHALEDAGWQGLHKAAVLAWMTDILIISQDDCERAIETLQKQAVV